MSGSGVPGMRGPSALLGRIQSAKASLMPMEARVMAVVQVDFILRNAMTMGTLG